MNRSVWFPGDLAERVQARADSLGRSFNWVVAQALESALGGVDSPPLAPPAPSRASAPNVESLARTDEELGSVKVPPEAWTPAPSRAAAFRAASQKGKG